MTWFSRKALKHLGSMSLGGGRAARKERVRRGAVGGGAGNGRWFEFLEERVLFATTPVDAAITKTVPVGSTTVTFSAADFTAAFTPATGSTATLANVTFTTVPSNGALTLSGVAVTANETVAVGNLGNLTYMKNGTFNGADVFEYEGTGSDGVSAAAADITVNDLPVLSNVVDKVIAENELATLTGTDFQSSFNDGANGSTLSAIEFTSLPSNGTLTVTEGSSTTTVGIDQVISLSSNPTLTYTPNAGFSGYDDFGYAASIDGTTFATNGASVIVSVLNPTPSVSAVNIPVFENQPTALTVASFQGGFTDGLSDGATDGLANITLENVQVVTLPASGTLELNGAPVTAGQTIAASDLANVTYTPNGTLSGNTTFSWTTSVSLDNHTYTAASNATVTLTGTPPTLTAVTATGLINSTLTIPSTDFTTNFSDSVNGGSFQGIEIVTVPTHGTLTIGSVVVAAGTTISVGSLGNITYTPNADYSGSDSFEWNATDYMGNLTDANAFTASNSTVTLTIQQPVTVSTITKTETLHSTSATFSVSDFTAGFTDLENGTLQNITITSLPAHGTLTLSGTAVGNGTTISAGNISQLVYTQTAGYTGSDSFGWSADDGMASALTAAVVDITIPADTAPVVTAVVGATTENKPLTFTAAQFTGSFTDADNTGNITIDSLQQIEITSLPAHGTLTLSGVAVTANQTISIGNITNLTYTPNTGYNEADTFGWNGSDGYLFATTGSMVAISIASPTVANISKSVAPNGTLTIAAADFQGAFSDSLAGDGLAEIQILSLPAHGTLSANGTAVAVNQVIIISNGTVLTYTPKAGYIGTDTFRYDGADDYAYASTAANVTLAVSIAPTLSTVTIPVKAGTPTALTLAEFTGAFADNTPNAKLQTMEITSLPSHGTLALNGVAVTANQTIAASSIGGLVYTPTQATSNASAFTGVDSFGWNASDGTQFAATAAVVDLDVDALPTLSVVTIPPALINVGTTFTASEFTGAFTDSNTGLSLETIQITSLPAHGTLRLSGVKVVAGESISMASIGSLTYTPVAGFVGSDSFGWNGSDGVNFAGASSGVVLSRVTDFDVLGGGTPIVPGTKAASASSLTDFGTWTILPDASMGADTRTFTILNSSNATITLGNITLSDTTDFTITSAPANTTLAAGANTTFTVAFNPLLVGKHAGTITINSSSASFPVFTYAIQGTAIHTTAVATTAGAAGGIVQEGTTKSGSGLGATNGQILGLVYTGYLASGGTIFDSTAIEGGAPLTFRLDDDYTTQPYLNSDQLASYLTVDQTLIPGFEYGLQGIKLGETRTLVINSTAGYGTSGSGSVPANATLIFDVKCVTLVSKPQLQVDSVNSSGQPTRILSSGQKIIAADDNTLFGLSNASSAQQNFQLVNYGTDDATGAAVTTWAFRGRGVVVSGDSKDFGVSINGRTMTVTFHPVKAGTRTATIEILTTDPLHPKFTFEVQGVSVATVDLIDGFKPLHLPKGTITSGTSKTVTLPLEIENIGNSAVPSGSKTNVQIYAENSAGTKTLVLTKNNLSLAGLGVNTIKVVNLTFALPAVLASGAYTFVAEVNQDKTEAESAVDATLATLTEVSTTNNSVTTASGVVVSQGINSLTGTLAASTVVHSASGVIGKLTVALQNIGTLTLPQGQTATVEIVAHPVGAADASTDIVLASGLVISLSDLGVGGVRSFPLSVDFTAAIASGAYDLEATITPVAALTGVTSVSVNANSIGNPVVLTV
jgi:FKBP-type peptidyl-prolyl cis-trans isomerase 2